MEREVLRVLDFDLTQPTIKTFLRRYVKAASGVCPAAGPLVPTALTVQASQRWLGPPSAMRAIHAAPSFAQLSSCVPLSFTLLMLNLPTAHPWITHSSCLA